MTVQLAHRDQHGALAVERLSGLLKAAADPLRLDILRLLGQSSFGVLELSELLDVSQSGMSHHLKVLAQAGLVETRREANSVFYRRRLPSAQETGWQIHRDLLDTLDELLLEAGVASRLERVQEQRAVQSREFFSRHAALFAERQDLIAEHHLYDDVASDMLERAKPAGGHKALEIGPGEGHFLMRLAADFDEVVGLDCEAELLQQAQQLLRERRISNARLVEAEWPKADPGANQDLVVMNMVLHHLPAPAGSMARAAEVLRADGVLLITELCRHEQDWVRETCGDLWQGFDEAELADWAKRAGLVPEESQFLALKNGFQIQVASFRKKAV
jgi:ArsR family transcriptional regulator